IALGLIALFAVTLGALPATGWRDLWIDPAGHARHLVLPVLATGIAESAVLVRLLRAGLIETLDQPYILAAQSRGMSTPVLLVTRALRPSSFSTLTIVGMTLGLAFGGSVLIESVFAIPGMGQLAMGAIETRDFPVIEAVIIFSGLAVVVASIAVDLIYSLVAPRTRRASRRSRHRPRPPGRPGPPRGAVPRPARHRPGELLAGDRRARRGRLGPAARPRPAARRLLRDPAAALRPALA